MCLSLALSLVGCGQVGFELVEDQPDAGLDANEPDAGDDAGPPRDPRTVTITEPLGISMTGAAGLQDGFIVAHNDPASSTGTISYVPEPAGSAWSEQVVAAEAVLLRGTDTYRDIAVTVGGGESERGIVIESDAAGVTSVDTYAAPVNHFRGVDVDREGWAAGGSVGDPDIALLVVDDAWSDGNPSGFEVDLGGTSSWLQGVAVTYERIYVVGQVLPSGRTVVAAIKRDTRTPLWATELTLPQFANLTRIGSELIVTDANHIVTMSEEGAVLSVQQIDAPDFEGITSVGEFAGALWFSGTYGGNMVFGTSTGDRAYALWGHGRGSLARNDRGWVVLASPVDTSTIELMPLDTAGELLCEATPKTLTTSTLIETPVDVTITVTPRVVAATPLTTVSLAVTESIGCTSP